MHWLHLGAGRFHPLQVIRQPERVAQDQGRSRCSGVTAGGVGICLPTPVGPSSAVHPLPLTWTPCPSKANCSLLPTGFALSLPLSLVSAHDLDLRSSYVADAICLRSAYVARMGCWALASILSSVSGRSQLVNCDI